ncbi:uncharacterized protein LOC106055608 [Biomphalaria glabrata]|uniref:Uncharacterized protein LOC106055608 n=1 Tax=Biomphalaria glabrata TaxID=6526 RepID=A0A9U8E0B3_BIOGL|nr:uncharacterized protein LOC106055608 [Biomphalaria glabrata]
MNTTSLLVLGVAVFCGVSALDCPRCVHQADPASCTDTRTCSNATADICHLSITTSNGHHRVLYNCQIAANCHLHETQHCDLTVDGHCNFCCDSLDSCKIQRDGIFGDVMSTTADAATSTTTAAP